MPKNFISKKTHLPKPHPKFTRVEATTDEAVFSIDYRKDVRRYVLAKDGEMVVSHVSPTALSRIAAKRYDVELPIVSTLVKES